jgi:hypothetical protein
MLYVVTGGWRNANFAQEPRCVNSHRYLDKNMLDTLTYAYCSIPTADIAEMCTALERMTAKDPSLAQEFGGTVFHRRVRR